MKAAKNKFVSGAALLAIASVVAKGIGALYRIPLTNILGAEGMGMYQLIFPVFALAMVLSTAGIPTALSRTVAEKRALGEPYKRYFVWALLALLALGGIACLIVFVLSHSIAKWQGNPSTAGGYMIVAPTLVLVGLIAGYRGLFQGEMNMLPTAVSNIIEQTVKLAVGIALSAIFIKRGVAAAVNGALLGVLCSEAAALLYLSITYLVKRKRNTGEKLALNKGETAGLIKMAAPIAAVAILLPLANFFDSVIIVNMLRLRGEAAGEATALYGLYSGPVNSLINMPVVIIMSLAVVVVPAVSMSRVKMDIDGVLIKSRLSIKLAYLLGIPTALLYVALAGRLLPIIYPALTTSQLNISAGLLRIASFNVVFMAAMQIYISLLQALDKTKYAVLSLVFAITIKIALSLFLTRFIGIYGGAIASVAMAFAALVFSNISYYKILGMRLEKNVALNALAGVIIAMLGWLVSLPIKSNLIAIFAAVAVSLTAYVVLVMLFGVVGREEIEYLPLKGVWKRLHRLIRFWEYRDET